MSIYDISVATVVLSLVTLSSKQGRFSSGELAAGGKIGIGLHPLVVSRWSEHYPCIQSQKHTQKVEGYDVPHHQIKAAGREIANGLDPATQCKYYDWRQLSRMCSTHAVTNQKWQGTATSWI